VVVVGFAVVFGFALVLGSLAVVGSAALISSAALIVGPVLVLLGGTQVLEDGRIVEPGVGTVGHAEEQLSSDVVNRAEVPGVFGGLGQRIDMPAGRGDPLDGQIIPGEVR
jgi:hypothetical protein